MAIKVITPGAFTTVQDLGRYGYQAVGIPCSGVMDQEAYRAANWLLSQENEAVLEMTLFGGIYCFTEETFIALTGADMEPKLNGKPCSMYQTIRVEKNALLHLGAARNGCRTYLAIRGGIAVPEVLGSRSTNIKCQMGGFGGRVLRSGDEIPIGESPKEPEIRELPKVFYQEEITLRVIEGPQADYFTEKGKETFYKETYTISEESDRMGCRIMGPAIEAHGSTDIISDGIVFGSVQVTTAGLPIVLMADRQTTGGYAKIAAVCSFDLPLLAQSRPGNRVRFEKISLSKAHQILKERSGQGVFGGFKL